MKKHFLPAVAVAALTIVAPPSAHADSAKVIVNGQDITADTADSGHIDCGFSSGTFNILLSHASYGPSSPGNALVKLSYPDQAKVVIVTVNAGRDQHYWSTQQSLPQTGSATVTKTGNSYKVTGTIAPYTGSSAGQPATGPGQPVPFEIDATCP